MHKFTAVALVSLLTACASVELPEWPKAGTPTTSGSASKSTPSASTPTPSGAQSQPVTPAPQLTPLPYNPSIEAQFPAPTVRYSTPGLGDNRQQFTTQTELTAWLQAVSSQATPGQRLEVMTIGQSQRGLPLLALIATQGASTQASALNANGKPTVMLVGQQRGDEPASAEALLAIARELGSGGLLSPLLQQINLIIVPRANPDGASSASPLTADGTNLLTDHLTLSTPEAQALAKLSRNYRPMSVIELREFPAAGLMLQKFQAVQSYELLLQPAATANQHEFIQKAAREWLTEPMRNALQQAQISHQWYFEPSPEPANTSLSMASPAANSLINTSSLKNAASVLISSRGSDLGRQHIQRRVHNLVTASSSALRSLAVKAQDLYKVESFVARDIASQACRASLSISAAPTPQQESIRVFDAASAQARQLQVDWKSSLSLQPGPTRARPCGYWLSADSSQAVERLRLQGIQVLQVAESGQMLGDTYQKSASTGQWLITRGAVPAPAQSYYITMNQPKANLIAAALEPDTPYSYLSAHLLDTAAQIARVSAPPTVVFEEEID